MLILLRRRAWDPNPPKTSAAVETAIALTDPVAVAATTARQEAMLPAFTRFVQYKRMFWDRAYGQEDWPFV